MGLGNWIKNAQTGRAAAAAEKATALAKSQATRKMALRTGVGAIAGGAGGYAYDGDTTPGAGAIRGAVLGAGAGLGYHALGGASGIKSKAICGWSGVKGAFAKTEQAENAVAKDLSKAPGPSTTIASNAAVGHNAPSASHDAAQRAKNQALQQRLRARRAQGASERLRRPMPAQQAALDLSGTPWNIDNETNAALQRSAQEQRAAAQAGLENGAPDGQGVLDLYGDTRPTPPVAAPKEPGEFTKEFFRPVSDRPMVARILPPDTPVSELPRVA